MRDVMAEFYDGPHATPAPATEGPIYLGIKNMTEDGHLDLSDIRHINESDYATWTRRVEPRPGDVIFTYEASLHRYAVIPEGFRGTLGRRVALLRPRPDVVDTRFLLYSFIGPTWRATVQRRINVGSTVDRLPLTDFPAFPITIPPLATQRKISAILASYDDLIENNNRRIKLLEEMGKRIYDEWFVAFRYPGHEAVALVESELGPIPAGWELAPLSAVCERITDGAHLSPATTAVGMPMASVKDMSPRRLDLESCRRIGIEDYNLLVRQDCRPLVDDVLIAKDGSYLKHVFVVRDSEDVVILSSIALLRPNSRIRPDVLSMSLHQPETRERLKGFVSGAAIPRIVLKDFRRFPIVRPPDVLQDEFVKRVEPLLSLALMLDKTSDVLRASRELLLPHLISGEIDVTDLDIALPEEAA